MSAKTKPLSPAERLRRRHERALAARPPAPPAAGPAPEPEPSCEPEAAEEQAVRGAAFAGFMGCAP